MNGIVKHLGIALHSRDASYVAATDPSEVHRVRDKHRVTVYYLPAEKYGQLDSFHGQK